MQFEDGHVFHATPSHHLLVNGRMQRADKVRMSDVLTRVDGGAARVGSVRRVYAHGLYNPHTLAGTIVVDGVLCSTYTDSVQTSMAQALLAPMRVLYTLGLVSERAFGSMLQHGANGASWKYAAQFVLSSR